jgi:hypothetical protein
MASWFRLWRLEREAAWRGKRHFIALTATVCLHGGHRLNAGHYTSRPSYRPSSSLHRPCRAPGPDRRPAQRRAAAGSRSSAASGTPRAYGPPCRHGSRPTTSSPAPCSGPRVRPRARSRCGQPRPTSAPVPSASPRSDRAGSGRQRCADRGPRRESGGARVTASDGPRINVSWSSSARRLLPDLLGDGD